MPDKCYFVDVKQFRTGWVRFEFKDNEVRQDFLNVVAANIRGVDLSLSEWPEE